MKTKLVILAAAAAAITGCTPQEAVENNKIELLSLTGHKVFILEDTAQEFGHDEDIAFRDSAAVIMPEALFGLDITPLRDKIMELAFDTVCPTPAEAMDIYFVKAAEALGYNTTEASDSLPESDIDGFDYVLGDIYSLNNRRLTYRVAKYTYNPGAAHGMQRCEFITYDLSNGEVITLHDLFTAEGLNALPGLIGRRARRLEQQIGPTSITALPAGGDFYISLEDEIVFVYQPYEVASYAQGMIYVPFYPYDLSEYLSPQGLSFFGLDKSGDF